MPDAVTFENFDPNQPDRSNVWGIYNDSTFKTKSARFVRAHWTWRRVSGKITSPPELLALCNACQVLYR